jgi:hypothetical protein
MGAYTEYSKQRHGNWQIWAVPEAWNDELWRAVTECMEALESRKHPQTREIQLPGTNERFFLKVFDRFSFFGTVKDIFRESKARRSLNAGRALAGSGFKVAGTLAAGEQRRLGILQRAFLLTSAVSATPLPLFLRSLYYSGGAWPRMDQKKLWLKELALEIRKLHDLGFVHGDLVPSNIMVSLSDDEAPRFFFLDNDRTRCYPGWLPQTFWRRNLVQLNRFPLPGVSLEDRMRFFHFYTGRRKCLSRDRKLLAWLEKRTRQRRRECDAVDASGSFRKLMRWDATAS